jgi:hypothetical protein
VDIINPKVQPSEKAESSNSTAWDLRRDLNEHNLRV